MAQTDELRIFADEHDLALISIADLIAWRRRHEKHVVRVADARIPTRHGDFRAVGYTSIHDDVEHVALVMGDLAGADGSGSDVLVRVHSECLTGDVFGSLRCDCGPQLDAAMEMVAAEGRGVVLYMRGHEGRGIGLLHKLQAYQLQDAARTPSMRICSSVCPPTPATTVWAHRSSSTSGSPRCACSPTIRPSGWDSTGTGCISWSACRCRCGRTRRICGICGPSVTGWVTISTVWRTGTVRTTGIRTAHWIRRPETADRHEPRTRMSCGPVRAEDLYERTR